MYTTGRAENIFKRGKLFIPLHHTEFFDNPASWPEDPPFPLKISSPSPRPPPLVYIMSAALVHSLVSRVLCIQTKLIHLILSTWIILQQYIYLTRISVFVG